MSTRTRTARIRSVEPLAGFALRLSFDDGTVREIDLEADLWGPVFEPLRDDPQLFRQVRVTKSSERSCGRTGLTWTPTCSMATLLRHRGPNRTPRPNPTRPCSAGP